MSRTVMPCLEESFSGLRVSEGGFEAADSALAGRGREDCWPERATKRTRWCSMRSVLETWAVTDPAFGLMCRRRSWSRLLQRALPSVSPRTRSSDHQLQPIQLDLSGIPDAGHL